MEIKQKVVNYYVANDGTEFDDEDKCLEYESKIELVKQNIRYYELLYGYGANGFMTNVAEIAVYSENQYLCENIIQEWATKEKNLNFIVMANVNEREKSLQKGFNIVSKGKDDNSFTNYNIGDKSGIGYSPHITEKVFLSPVEIKGFPEPFNYIEKWGLKI